MSVVPPQLSEAIAAAEAAVDAGAWGVGSASEAIELLNAAERLRRLAGVVTVDALTTVHKSSTYYEHGHISARAMAGHTTRSSSGDAARADKVRKLVERCDLLANAWRTGSLSIDQAAVLGRAFANPRVRNAMVEAQPWFLKMAERPFRVFERRVADWVRLNDTDGAAPQPDPSHERRDASFLQDHFSQAWTLRAGHGSLQGAKMRRIFDAYVEAERLADWEVARAELGDAACKADLARTPAQQRADALEQIFADALHSPERSVSIETVHAIVWSEQTHTEMLRRYAGAAAKPIDADHHRCADLDGNTVDTTAAFADFLVTRWRRVVVDAKSVTVDLGESQRFFVGLSRLGVQINFDTCYWPCDVPVSRCQIDHVRPAARGGPTNQDNGAPACQRHNRLKERGYSVARLSDGTIEITTPNGEVVPQ